MSTSAWSKSTLLLFTDWYHASSNGRGYRFPCPYNSMSWGFGIISKCQWPLVPTHLLWASVDFPHWLPIQTNWEEHTYFFKYTYDENLPSEKFFWGLPVVAQWKWIWLVSMRMQVQSLASLSGLRIWCCCELWCRSQMWLRSGVAVAVVKAGSCSSNSTPSPGTSICQRYSPKKTNKQGSWYFKCCSTGQM